MADSSPEGVLEWISYLQKNKPQSNALVGGLFVMLFSGQHLAWGIFNSNLDPLAWNGSVEWTSSITFWMLWLIISWFIAAAVGAYIGAIFVKIMKKIKIYVSVKLRRQIEISILLFSVDLFFLDPAQLHDLHHFFDLDDDVACREDSRRAVAWNRLHNSFDSCWRDFCSKTPRASCGTRSCFHFHRSFHHVRSEHPKNRSRECWR